MSIESQSPAFGNVLGIVPNRFVFFHRRGADLRPQKLNESDRARHMTLRYRYWTMVTTRMLLSVLAMVGLTAGAVAIHRDHDVVGAWLLAFGFLVASVWGILTLVLGAQEGVTPAMDPDITKILTSMAIVFMLFYLQRAVNRRELL